jgi:hypothetical protein
MSTYSASRRVKGFGHPLNGRLGGYCQGLVPRVTGYGPKPGYDLFPPMAHGWGTKHPVPDKAPPLLVEEVVLQPKKS